MTEVALGLRIVAATRAGAMLATRPRSQVVHLVPPGPLTPSGRFLPRAARTVCRGRTGRLHLLPADVSGVGRAGRRFCRRCTAVLPTSLGTTVSTIHTRDAIETAFAHLQLPDLVVANAWARTVAESYQVGTVASVVLGPAPFRRPTAEGAARQRWQLERSILARRDRLRQAERTAEQREADQRIRDAEADDRRRTTEAARTEAAREADDYRRRHGRYRTPWDKARFA